MLVSVAVILGLIGERIGMRGADAAVSLVVAAMVALAAGGNLARGIACAN